MYRLLTGKFAFPGTTKMDRMVKRIQQRHVPITDVRKDLPVPLVAVIDRLLSPRPEDRFSSDAEVAEELEMLLPVADRPKRVTRASPGSQQLRTSTSSALSEPEAPLDWSVIESAAPVEAGSRRETALTTRSAALDSPRPTSTCIDSHRRNLEDEGVESGRRVQQEYRKELIQLKRALVEERTQDQTLEPPTVAERWLERLGEQVGDFLAEPSAGHIILILVALAIIVALGLAYSLS